LMARIVPQQAVERVMLGHAVGESLGLPYALSGSGPATRLEPLVLGGAAAYGAATEQAVLLAETMAESCGFNPSALARALAARADVDNPVRLYSLATAEHVLLMRRGYMWTDARSMVASLEPPLDAVARATPLPLFYTKERLVAEMAAAQLMVTSLDRRSADASRAYALTLYYLLHGLTPSEAVEEAAAQTPRQGIRDSLYAALEAASISAGAAERVVSRPGDPLSQLLASAAAALVATQEGGLEPLEALRLAIASSPPGASHVAGAMAGALLAAAGWSPRIEPSLEAEEMVRRAAGLLAAASARCHGVGANLGVAAESSG
jgi:hypothetical protein